MAPAEILKSIWNADPDPGYRGIPWPKAGRQFAVMNAKGEYAAEAAGVGLWAFCASSGAVRDRDSASGRNRVVIKSTTGRVGKLAALEV